MALDKEDIQRIISKHMPAMEVVDNPNTRINSNPPRRPSPSLEELKRKYLGENYSKEELFDSSSSSSNDNDSTVVYVNSKKNPDNGPGPRAVIISDDGTIIGVQG